MEKWFIYDRNNFKHRALFSIHLLSSGIPTLYYLYLPFLHGIFLLIVQMTRFFMSN